MPPRCARRESNCTIGGAVHVALCSLSWTLVVLPSGARRTPLPSNHGPRGFPKKKEGQRKRERRVGAEWHDREAGKSPCQGASGPTTPCFAVHADEAARKAAHAWHLLGHCDGLHMNANLLSLPGRRPVRTHVLRTCIPALVVAGSVGRRAPMMGISQPCCCLATASLRDKGASRRVPEGQFVSDRKRRRVASAAAASTSSRRVR